MKPCITLNQEERLFVISTGNGYSCLGFDVVFAQAEELALRLRKRGVPCSLWTPSKVDIGTLKQYEQYQTLFGLYSGVNDITTWFDNRTPSAVQAALEKLRSGKHITRIFYGDVETGRSWMDENDVVGRLTRSCGPMKVPLLRVDSVGGCALLTHCIVRIVDVNTGSDVYKHPTFHVPRLDVVVAASYDKPFTHAVKAETRTGEMELVANFRSKEKAQEWVSFIKGDIHVLPEHHALAA